MKNIKKTLVVLILCSFIMGTIPVSVLAQQNSLDNKIFEHKGPDLPDGVEYVSGELIVKFTPGISNEKIASINSRYGTSVEYTSPYAGFKILHIPKGKTVPEMVEKYNRNPNVEYAVVNSIAHAFMAPNDEYYSYQWHLDNDEYGGINMEAAWDISDGTGVIVAVLDSGVAYEDYGTKYKQAPDLANTHFVAGYDFVNNDAHPNDDNSHGTHVAGTIAQSTNNGIGVAGVAFNCTIMPVKVLNKRGSGTLDQLVDGIYFATNNSADVISMSLGWPPGYDPGKPLKDALDYAYNNGVTIVSSSGNDAASEVSYPAAHDKCIAVGATRYDETRAGYSNYGPALDIMAPGGDSVDQNGDGYDDGVLQNTFNPNTKNPSDFGYWFFQGTSMAAPHVSGVAALLIANGVTGPDNVREALESTAEDHGDDVWDPEYGHGIVDAHAALLWTAGQPVLTAIVVSPSSATLIIDDTEQFTATGKDQYDKPIDTGTITWVSSNITVGTIDQNGLFAASSAGTTTISAINGGVTGTSNVIVNEAPILTTIEVSPSSATLIIDDTEQFTATGKDQYDEPIDTGTITWVSSNITVGTIDQNGLFAASSAGTTTISATNGGVTGTSNVIVNEAPILTTIEVSPSSATLNIDDTQQFTSICKDQYDDPIDTCTITWESTNTTVGIINLTGLFTASSAGSTTINATSGDVTGTASVTVKEASTTTMSVSNIEMWYSVSGPNNFIYTKVTVLDSGEAPVLEAMVYLKTTLPDYSIITYYGYTNSDGTVTFKLKSQQTGEYISEVTEVTHTDLIWDENPASNSTTVV
jgi:serine protease